MGKIEQGQFSSLLRRYLGMVGESHVADELAPEISAVLALESDRPEWEFLKGAKLMSVVATQPAAVTEAGAVRLRNPAGSNVVGIIEEICITVGVGGGNVLVTVGNDAGDLGTTLQSNSRDTRYPRVAFPGNSALIASRASGANGDGVYSFSATVSAPFVIKAPFVITPGFQIQVTELSTNITLQVTYLWLEKRLDALEQR